MGLLEALNCSLFTLEILVAGFLAIRGIWHLESDSKKVNTRLLMKIRPKVSPKCKLLKNNSSLFWISITDTCSFIKVVRFSAQIFFSTALYSTMRLFNSQFQILSIYLQKLEQERTNVLNLQIDVVNLLIKLTERKFVFVFFCVSRQSKKKQFFQKF